jgi:hypothetical protein
VSFRTKFRLFLIKKNKFLFDLMNYRKARQYYVYDLSLNPNRFDSWAASALTRTFEVDQQLLSVRID